MASRPSLFALFLALAFVALPAHAETPRDAVELTLPQARQLALKLAISGESEQAEAMARALLQTNPMDDAAWFALATAWREQGDLDRARRGAARAFRYTDDGLKRTQAAGLAARSALEDQRYMLAQYWLRRGAHVAPNHALRQRVARDFANVRAQTPLGVRLRFSLAPSSNLNGGAQSYLNEIDGISAVGVLSGGALALSGLDARTTVELSYRLSDTQRAQTKAHSLIYLRSVRLSDEARSIAPAMTNKDLSLQVFEAGLSRTWRLGAGSASLHLRGDLGKVQSAGEPYFSYHRLTVKGTGRLTEAVTHQVRLSRELRNPADGSRHDVLHSVEGALTWSLPRNDALEVSLRRGFIDDGLTSRDGFSDSLALRYQRGQPVAGVNIGIDLAAGRSEYPDYAVGVILVPGGRQDKTLSATLHMDFTSLGYMGFAPRLSLRAYETKSNVSRFETDGLSLTLGFRSAF